MNELLARAGSVFLTPASAPAARSAVVTGPPPELVGVLAEAGDLLVVAGGLASDLRRRLRARTALVCAVAPLPPSRAATRAAAAVARRLAGHDLDTAPAGAICRVALPADAEAATRVVWRAAAVASGVPMVFALGARSDAHDQLLAQADQLVLAAPAGASPSYTDLAHASLAALGPPTARIAVPAGPLARRRAALGLARLSAEPPAALS